MNHQIDSARVAPCVWYENDACAALTYYVSIFPNAALTEHHASRNDQGQPWSYTCLLGHMPLLGINGGKQFRPTPAISIFVRSCSGEELRRFWGALSQNSTQVLMDLRAYDWAPLWGWISDAWGLTWQLMLDESMAPEQSPIFTPAMLFAGDQLGMAEPALRRYESLISGAELGKLDRYSDGELEGKIRVAELTVPGGSLTAMDNSSSHHFMFTEGVSLMARCSDQAEIDRLWDGLTADGGAPSQCGWLKDSFGVSWQIIPENLGDLMSDPERGPARMKALMTMKKLDLAALERTGQEN